MMPSRISPHLRAADARRVNAMALHMDPEDIAGTLGVPLAEVLDIVRRDARAARWIGRCDRTGRTVAALTERGAYLRAQIAGFADWTLYGEAKR